MESGGSACAVRDQRRPVGTRSRAREPLLPLFLHHHYQAIRRRQVGRRRLLTYSVRTASGPNQARWPGRPGATKAALAALLDTVTVDALRIPERILQLIPPTASGYGNGTAEKFEKRTDPVFDPIGAATIAADITVTALLQPQRAARTIEQHGRDQTVPGFGDVVNAIVQRTWSAAKPADGYGQAIQEAVQSLVVQRLMDLAADMQAAPQVRAQASAGLRRIKTLTGAIATANGAGTREDITRFLSRPADAFKKTDPLPTPAGEPIGGKGGY